MRQSLADAIGMLEAEAEFDGEERELFVRVAEHNGAIQIDLGDLGFELPARS